MTLSGKQNRYTILTIAALPIFSKAYYAAHDFEASTLDPPLGSGAYKVGTVSAGRFIEYQRVPDYWGKDLPVNVGTNNFDIIRIDFYKERQAAFEAFKKGDITFREEFTSITWAQDYGFPAVTAGKVKKSEFPAELRPSMQGWFFNTRLAKFRDPRTRLAIGLAFDFEWTNRNLFFDSYQRLASYFEKSDFAATGTPSPEELKLLDPFRAELPPEVFAEAYVPPKGDGSGHDRKLLRQAADLLAAAGWKSLGNDVVDEEGAPLEVEFLIDAAVFERVITPYTENLKRIGVQATDPPGRSGAVRAAPERLRFRRHRRGPVDERDAARRPAAVLFFHGRRHQGELQLRRHQGKGGRRDPRQASLRSARARS